MKREVKADMGEMGTWKVICDSCPLLPHLQALEQPARACVVGMSTRMQGAIPINACKYYVEGSADIKGKGKKAKVTIECNYGASEKPQ